MKVIEYEPGDRAIERRLAELAPAESVLGDPDFYDYYFSDPRFCVLKVVVDSAGDVAGAIGIEKMPFVVDGAPTMIGFGVTYHAFQKGAGIPLFFDWLKSADYTLTFGGSDDAHALFARHRWVWAPRIPIYIFNRQYRIRGDDRWSAAAAKRLLNFASRPADLRRRIDKHFDAAGKSIQARRANAFSPAMLPDRSPFLFRFAPSVEYLSWRYRLDHPRAKYELYELIEGGATLGYVVLGRTGEQVFVAQADASAPDVLGRGMLAALAESNGPIRGEVWVASTNQSVQNLFAECGFRRSTRPRPFVVCGRNANIPVQSEPDQWLISFDWGDNGLRNFFGRST